MDGWSGVRITYSKKDGAKTCLARAGVERSDMRGGEGRGLTVGARASV